ncbi:MAG: hypothetical protein JZU53_07095 [Paludibacter sp.]|nr:hypothetical protein [Paludibacter sp.]
MKKFEDRIRYSDTMGKTPGKDQDNKLKHLLKLAIKNTLSWATEWEPINTLTSTEDVIMQTTSGRMFRGQKAGDHFLEFDGFDVNGQGSSYVRCYETVESFRQIEFKPQEDKHGS